MDDTQLKEMLTRDCGIAVFSSSSVDSIDSEIDNQDTLPNVEMDITLGGRYQGLRILGYGNSSTVIKGLDLVSKTIVALKMFRVGQKYDRRAKYEKSVLDYLRKRPVDCFSNIVRYTDYFKHDNNSCIVFEKLGHTLKHLIKKNKNGLNRNTVRTIIRSVMEGLQCLHEYDIIHTDIKPSNIAQKYTNSFECKILDVGGSTFAARYVTGRPLQTPMYRAPEVFLGASVNSKVDIWSVGLITVELLTGSTFVKGDTNNEQMYDYISCFGIPPKKMLDKSMHLNMYFVTDGAEVKFKRSADGSLHEKKTKQVQDILKIQDDPVLADFIEKCLHMDPEKRLSAKEAINHPFISKQASSSTSTTSTPEQSTGSMSTTV